MTSLGPVLLDHLLELVGTLLMVAAVPVLRALYRKVEAWTGLKIEAEERRRLEDFVLDGISRAEQWARVRSKSGQPTTGAEKLEHAIEHVNGTLKASGLPDVAKERIAALIEAKLGQW